jgi:hypothetical protein
MRALERLHARGGGTANAARVRGAVAVAAAVAK